MAFSLIPRNDAYFDDFDAAIANVGLMCAELRESVRGAKLDRTVSIRLHDLELKGDEIKKRCLTRLDNSFITPIEREDIHLLAVAIDDMGDAIESVAGRFELYDINEPTEFLKSTCDAIVGMSEALRSSVRDLRTLDPTTIRAATTRVFELEDSVDRLTRDALRDLFQRRPEAYDLVRWKEIYERLEHIADLGHDLGRAVNHILVRHS